MTHSLLENVDLVALIYAIQDGTINKSQFTELEERLKASSKARELYVYLMDVHAGLILLEEMYPTHVPQQVRLAAQKNISQHSIKPKRLSAWKRFLQPSLFIPLCLLLALGISWGGIHLFQNHLSPKQQVVKTDQLQIGKRRELTQGRLKLTFPTGVKVFITAPAVFQVTGKNEISLSQGMLLANVATKAGMGFTVNTPSGSIVDLGTIFGVEVDELGASDIQVFKGKVELASSSGKKITLLAGNAMRCKSANQQWQKIGKLSDNFYRASQKHSSNVVLFHEPNEGLWGPDEFTGVSYVIYSAIPFTKRLRDSIRNKRRSSSDDKLKWRYSAKDFAIAHLAIVHFDEVTEKWVLHFNEVPIEFTPVSTDLILARIDLKGQDLPQGIEGRHQVTFYQENYGAIHNISHGYQTSDIDIHPDWIDGVDNFADHTLKGTYFIRKAE